MIQNVSGDITAIKPDVVFMESGVSGEIIYVISISALACHGAILSRILRSCRDLHIQDQW